MNNEDVGHIYDGILLSHKKEQNNVICSLKDATRDQHTKQRKAERERAIPHDITYLWYLKYDTNRPAYKTETEPQTQEQTGGCQGRRVWGKDGVRGWGQQI